MAINFREGYWGLRHLCLAMQRRLFKLSEQHFLQGFAELGSRIQVLKDENGRQRLCERCGFSLVSYTSDSGWTIETCSALPVVDLRDAGFVDWLEDLSQGEKSDRGEAAKHNARASSKSNSDTESECEENTDRDEIREGVREGASSAI